LKTEFPEQIEIADKDFFTLPKLTFQDNQDGGSRVQSLFCGVPKAEWKDGRYCVYCNIMQECLYKVLCLCHAFVFCAQKLQISEHFFYKQVLMCLF
jgi:hypothetical protein